MNEKNNMKEQSKQLEQKQGDIPERGFVPDEITAKKIAEAVWFPLYGKLYYGIELFEAKYDEEEHVWHVHGYLPKGHLGSAPTITIHKQTGEILYVFY